MNTIAKAVIGVVGVIALVTACSDKEPTYNVEEVKANHNMTLGGKTERIAWEYTDNSNIKRHVKQSMNGLKDPSSAEFVINQVVQQLLEVKETSTEFVSYRICVSVNAKNGFGGYTGFSPMIVFLNDTTVRLVEDPLNTCEIKP